MKNELKIKNFSVVADSDMTEISGGYIGIGETLFLSFLAGIAIGKLIRILVK